jgi:hypothetical protein
MHCRLMIIACARQPMRMRGVTRMPLRRPPRKKRAAEEGQVPPPARHAQGGSPARAWHCGSGAWQPAHPASCLPHPHHTPSSAQRQAAWQEGGGAAGRVSPAWGAARGAADPAGWWADAGRPRQLAHALPQGWPSHTSDTTRPRARRPAAAAKPAVKEEEEEEKPKAAKAAPRKRAAPAKASAAAVQAGGEAGTSEEGKGELAAPKPAKGGRGGAKAPPAKAPPAEAPPAEAPPAKAPPAKAPPAKAPPAKVKGGEEGASAEEEPEEEPKPKKARAKKPCPSDSGLGMGKGGREGRAALKPLKRPP